MANYQAVSAVSSALIGLLKEHAPLNEFGKLDFAVFHVSDYDQPKIKDGFSICLYRVAISGSNPNLQPRRTANNRQYRPSLPLDLYYLLTPWSGDPIKQHLMLAWAMRFLEDMSVIQTGILNNYAPNTFGTTENIEFVRDPLPINDFFNLWDKLKPKMQTSMTYVARMVLIDSQVEHAGAVPVQTRGNTAGTGESS